MGLFVCSMWLVVCMNLSNVLQCNGLLYYTNFLDPPPPFLVSSSAYFEIIFGHQPYISEIYGPPCMHACDQLQQRFRSVRGYSAPGGPWCLWCPLCRWCLWCLWTEREQLVELRSWPFFPVSFNTAIVYPTIAPIIVMPHLPYPKSGQVGSLICKGLDIKIYPEGWGFVPCLLVLCP